MTGGKALALLLAGLIFVMAEDVQPGLGRRLLEDALRAAARGGSRSHSNGTPITQFERGARA